MRISIASAAGIWRMQIAPTSNPRAAPRSTTAAAPDMADDTPAPEDDENDLARGSSRRSHVLYYRRGGEGCAMLRAVIALLVLLVPSTVQAKRVALVVGINKYDNLPRERQLVKAVNDARAMEVALKAVGFDVIKAEDVGRSAFNQAWQQLLNKVQAGDEVAVFYSGHGVEIEGGNFLIPRDVPAVGSGEVRRLKNEALSFDELRRDLATQAPKLSLYIIDACRDNPFTDTRGRSIGGSKGLVPVQAEEGSFIMFAAGARESALDRLDDADRDPNSVYTRKLLPLLKEPGLRLPEVAQRVRSEVRQLANTIGHRQSPAYYDEGADTVCLAGCVRASAAPEVSEAAREWSRVDKTSIAELETFARRHGQSPEADYAHARIEALRQQVAAVPSPKPPMPAPTKPAQPSAAVTPTPPPARCDGVEALVGNEKRCLKPKDVIRDCPDCPEMVVVPAGTFTMGSPENERPLKDMEEQPAHEVSVLQARVLRKVIANYETQVRVSIAKPFAVGRFAVTFDQWDACVADGGCNGYKPDDKGWGRGEYPVINVNWDDARSYIAWLSRKTGKIYRLMSEAEREYVTRAGTTTPFWWGTTITSKQANFNGKYVYPVGSKGGEFRQRTVPVGSFQANPWGLYNVHGNVKEWTEDCWYEDNKGNPGDGRARTSRDCRRATRGGSWDSEPEFVRSASRDSQSADYRGSIGFRLARTLNP